MRYIFAMLLILVVGITLRAQSIHNYFSPTSGLYVQIGQTNNGLLFRIPNGRNSFVTLSFRGTQNGYNYYGSSTFQVAVQSDFSRLCILTNEVKEWYNYCGAVPVPNPYTGTGTDSSTRSATKNKCPWCNGTGKITKNDHVPQYGTNSVNEYRRCNECGTEYNATYTNHYHLNCGHCGGRGYLEN